MAAERAWEALRGGTFELVLGDDVFEIDVPEDYRDEWQIARWTQLEASSSRSVEA